MNQLPVSIISEKKRAVMYKKLLLEEKKAVWLSLMQGLILQKKEFL